MGRGSAIALSLSVCALGACQGSPAQVAGAQVTARPARVAVAPAVVAPAATVVSSPAGCLDHRGVVAAELPAVGAATVGGVALPPGRPVDGGAAWVTDAPVPGAAAVWAALVDRYPATGLWPVLVTGSPAWRTEPVALDDVPAAAALARVWERTLPAGVEWDETVRDLVWPFHRAPAGVGPGVITCAGPVVETVSGAHDARLALVAVARPADVVAHLAWPGDASATAALVRSWENRFGAFVVAVGDGTVQLGVERPPPVVDDAYRLAAELFAVDPTTVIDDLSSIGALATQLPNRRTWFLTP